MWGHEYMSSVLNRSFQWIATFFEQKRLIKQADFPLTFCLWYIHCAAVLYRSRWRNVFIFMINNRNIQVYVLCLSFIPELVAAVTLLRYRNYRVIYTHIDYIGSVWIQIYRIIFRWNNYGVKNALVSSIYESVSVDLRNV